MIRLIKDEKATMIVEHISYNRTEQQYDTTIFTNEKNRQSADRARSQSVRSQSVCEPENLA
ncbi:MAG: hypothetical protein J6W05_07160 [Prevotella sp.]|nr:hypothetical protein [Prevotella sp.]